MSAQDDYEKHQLEWLQNTGLKVGDRVMCIGTPDPNQCGWQGAWSPNMHVVFGEIGEITDISAGSQGIGVRFAVLQNVYKRPYFPFFVLIPTDE